MRKTCLISSFILSLIIVYGAALTPAQALPRSISFAGSEKSLPSNATLSISAIDIETSEIRDVVITRPRARVSVDCDTTYCLATLSGNGRKRVKNRVTLQEYFGISRSFGAELTATKLRTIRIATSSGRKLLSVNQAASPAISANVRVGVPGNAFTLTGDLTREVKPGGISASVITTLVHSPCYRSGKDFSVIETDPRILGAIKREFDLIKQGFVTPNPDFVNRAQTPNSSISGTVSSKGDAATATIQLTGSDGAIIATATASTSTGGWPAAVNQAALDIAGQLCEGPKVAINFPRCKLQKCVCCNRQDDDCLGFRILIQLDGTAKLPLGGIMYASLPYDNQVTQDCGGALSTTFFGSALACSRLTAEQPQNFDWKFGVTIPKAPACTCPRSTAPESVSAVATVLDPSTGNRDDVILSALACSLEE